ncbi:hypothetical protein [uncultured Sphingomonas sp.]|uniref:hypothetical protein n=1 Tax=uncultured Sphingomonas sp. TaxID=158754 RepID=UPI0035CBB8FB
MLLGLVALCILLGANLTQVFATHSSLEQVIQRQKEGEPTIAKVDAQLDALASGTQRLAAGGNANAAKIITALAENGIQVKSSH